MPYKGKGGIKPLKAGSKPAMPLPNGKGASVTKTPRVTRTFQ